MTFKNSPDLNPEFLAGPREVKAARKAWDRYRVKATLKTHPELDPSDLFAYFQNRPSHDMDISGFHAGDTPTDLVGPRGRLIVS